MFSSTPVNSKLVNPKTWAWGHHNYHTRTARWSREPGALSPMLHSSEDGNPPAIHLIVQHGTTGGHFSQPPAGDQRRAPWSRGVERPCNFVLGNKMPGLFLLRAMQHPFLEPPPNVGIQLKPNKTLGGTARCVENLVPSLSLDLLPFGFPELPAYFFATEKRK